MEEEIEEEFRLIESLDVGVNPYTTTLKIKVNLVPKTSLLKKVEAFPDYYPLDDSKPVKLYRVDGVTELIDKLPSNAKELYLYMIYRLRDRDTVFHIDKKKYMDRLEIKSINTVKSAIRSLIKANIIQMTVDKDVYWINPSIFFRGSRVTTFPNNLVARYPDGRIVDTSLVQ